MSESKAASYFAYGTLLGTQTMREYCPSAEPRAVGSLAGHTLEFRQYSDDPSRCGCELADAPGQDLWGVVYDLTSEDMQRLNEISGVPQGWYEQIPITVVASDGSQIETTTYRLVDPGDLQTPDDDYIGLVRDGSAGAGLPAAYVEGLHRYLASLER